MTNSAYAKTMEMDFCMVFCTNAFLSPGVNSRAELVPSPRDYARGEQSVKSIDISFKRFVRDEVALIT
jgi:hypothetical protein